uniref:Uncharacterized protein n=1 Tax=Chromera velia CCMP2878 TaxID=1169474 RepID=A0A0G4HIE8_9ALVE|eukprot:Cvel_27925.t1-p1 / transcript=Cvel_27925.t1 / gene=Cvel_27925 / organism=Chromera_velia_CCMP2878 / gene_product=hypothetical protein / transcript_product=hypothetical protein / location=Cvel_scaffold3559:8318-10352(+) / protein_length=218 / sequence_SO=supercontig / SO=protein_coding / is_pseudo=false
MLAISARSGHSDAAGSPLCHQIEGGIFSASSTSTDESCPSRLNSLFRRVAHLVAAASSSTSFFPPSEPVVVVAPAQQQQPRPSGLVRHHTAFHHRQAVMSEPVPMDVEEEVEVDSEGPPTPPKSQPSDESDEEPPPLGTPSEDCDSPDNLEGEEEAEGGRGRGNPPGGPPDRSDGSEGEGGGDGDGDRGRGDQPPGRRQIRVGKGPRQKAEEAAGKDE